jgi:hypothetical protein
MASIAAMRLPHRAPVADIAVKLQGPGTLTVSDGIEEKVWTFDAMSRPIVWHPSPAVWDDLDPRHAKAVWT